MGKMTYKRRKNVKKQSFKKRKNKKMKGGDATDATPEVAANAPTPDAEGAAATETPATDANTEGAAATDANTEGAAATDDNTEGAATTDDNTSETPDAAGDAYAAAKTDDGYVQFLKELKENPGEILLKKVYVWEDVSEIYMYNDDAKKWENRIDKVTESANKTGADADDAAKTDAKTDATTDPATTDPATTDPATTDPATTDPAAANADAAPEGAVPETPTP